MTRYTPVYAGTVTRYVIVESFEITPADLAVRAYEIANGVMIKETCFGLVINGPETDVDRVIAEIRKADPDHIFVKDRGFPPGDARRCRANLGGARPGYHGIEYEMTIIPYVSHGLEEIKKRDLSSIPPPDDPLQPHALDIEKLKKLMESQES
ncbi:MAG: methanogenesis marker 6 protein [Methanomicrobiales archaeon]|nr:methanogenesis marker 6 protein [Methanomicrobiales archaeon]